MTTQPPKRYLSPDAEPWGRWVEDTLNDLRSDITQSNQSINNTLASINGTLIQVSSQLSSINTLISQVVTPASITASSSGFAVTVSPSVVVTTTLTVPSGITQAVVIVNAWAYVNNNAGVPVILDLTTWVNGVGSIASEVTFGTGVAGTLPPSMMSPLVTGLVAGGTFTVQGKLASSTVLTTSASNRAGLNGTVLWLR